jgi:hypothetical protein
VSEPAAGGPAATGADTPVDQPARFEQALGGFLATL